MIPVDSEFLSEVDYDASALVLTILFRDRSLYSYSAVPRSVFEKLMAADSHGTYFRQHIMGQYRTTQLR